VSGGHWDYLGFKLMDRASYAGSVWKLLGAIERDLDWGISGDTCLDCARIRAARALEAYFDTEATDETIAVRWAKSTEPECADCREREASKQAKHIADKANGNG
jgi:hypothetical protein